MDVINFILLLLLALGILGNNVSISVAVSVLLLMRLLNLQKWIPILENHGLQVGIIILTIGVLAPISSGRISVEDMISTIKNPSALLGIVVGIAVSYLGGKGVQMISTQPLIVTGLLIGTILGVAFFKGVPVGPLIAAGGVTLLMRLFRLQ